MSGGADYQGIDASAESGRVIVFVRFARAAGARKESFKVSFLLS
jgi:hypothetical protein